MVRRPTVAALPLNKYERVNNPETELLNVRSRAKAQDDALVTISLAGMTAWINLFGKSLDDWI